MKIIRSFFGNGKTEKLASFIFPILIAIATGFATNFSIINNSNAAITLWFVTGILSFIFILFLLFCWHFQKVKKEINKNRDSDINEHFMDLGNRLNKYITAYMYNDFYVLNSLGKGELNEDCFIDFNKKDKFKHIWQNICEDLNRLISVLKFSGNNFGVNIIARMQNGDEVGYFMPAFDYTERVDSRSNLTSTFKNEKDLKTPYTPLQSPYYLKFFTNSKIKAEILTTEKEFKDNFKDYNSNYKQLISIPIIYKTSTIAVLQLIGYNKSEILNPNEDKAILLKQINNYFFVYEKLALLTLILGLKS